MMLAKQCFAATGLSQKIVFNATNLKALRLRMKSIEAIKKITKAMKMVAASKMRLELTRLNAGEGFGVQFAPKLFESETYLQKRLSQNESRSPIYVPLTSDRGLCGGVNTNVIRETKRIVKESEQLTSSLLPLGEKGQLALVRPYPDRMLACIDQVETPINLATASSIATQIWYMKPDADSVTLIYNKFKNALTQVVTTEQLMTRKQFQKHFKYIVKHEISEPEKEYSQHHFYELYLSSAFYSAMLHAYASEQSSRMNAMENAAKNAGEMLDRLTLQYNKTRQAKITMELCEIIAGANAL